MRIITSLQLIQCTSLLTWKQRLLHRKCSRKKKLNGLKGRTQERVSDLTNCSLRKKERWSDHTLPSNFSSVFVLTNISGLSETLTAVYITSQQWEKSYCSNEEEWKKGMSLEWLIAWTRFPVYKTISMKGRDQQKTTRISNEWLKLDIFNLY